MATIITIHHRGERIVAGPDTWEAQLASAVQRLGPWEPGKTRVDTEEAPAPAAVQVNSTWETQVTDESARVRIEGQQQALRDAGITVNAGEQLYSTGTRMADVGYDTQRDRKAQHEQKVSMREAAALLSDTVRSEKRREITLSGGEMAKRLAMNGKLTLDGYRLSERAIRGMLNRAESPAATYVMGLRDRIVEKHSAADKSHLLATLIRELDSAPDTQFMLRVRDGITSPDVFTVVSPSYGVADAPVVMPTLVDGLPADCKATYSYDAESTSWEIRAAVWTPTPVEQQAVGEAFEAYASFRSNDAGGGRLTPGGGVTLLRCLNASVYEALVTGLYAARTHRSGILTNLSPMVKAARKAIDTLVEAWGTARTAELPCPEIDGALIPIHEAIPGFFRHLLVDRHSALQGVLAGRRETHVEALARTYTSERRDPTKIVRSDLAQAMTRYAHELPAVSSRALEGASAAWLTSGHVPRYEAL